MTERAFYTPKEIAEMLGISRSKVQDLLDSEEIASVYFGPRARRVPKKFFDDYVTAKIQDAESRKSQRKLVPLARQHSKTNS